MIEYTLERRNRVLVNTDPQRRCYNGCHFSSELQWTDWVVLELCVKESKVDSRIKFWKDLNDYAVESRGESARSEFRAVKNPPFDGHPCREDSDTRDR